MRNTEQQIGIALCEWWSYEAKSRRFDERLLIHIPNEGKRTPWGGKRLKDSGLRAGTPDYFLAIAKTPYHGLFIEIKSENGKLQGSQKEMLNVLSCQEYCADVAYGLDQAIKSISSYLNL
jgi:hypothetical protein